MAITENMFDRARKLISKGLFEEAVELTLGSLNNSIIAGEAFVASNDFQTKDFIEDLLPRLKNATNEISFLSIKYDGVKNLEKNNVVPWEGFAIERNELNKEFLYILNEVESLNFGPIHFNFEMPASLEVKEPDIQYYNPRNWLEKLIDRKVRNRKKGKEIVLNDILKTISKLNPDDYINSAMEIESKELHLLGSGLDSLPQSIKNLTELKELNLSANNFQIVPKEILHLKKLRVLDLSDNHISFLPEWLLKLPDLEVLNIRDNEFDYIPSEIYAKPAKELINYVLKASKKEEYRRLDECKLIVVGSGGVGKTSLINMLTTGNYDTDEQKTDGIEIKKWEIDTKDKKVKVNIWDFGGQEIMHATHRFFMTRRSVYVLVVNPRIDDKYGDTEIMYWLKLITSFSPNSSIIVAINKCETHKTDFGEEGLKEAFPQIIDFVETSCPNGTGISKLKEKITIGIEKTPHLNDKLPATFFEIRRRLEAKNDAYMQYHQYLSLCKEIDSELDETLLKTFVGLLNDLGIMLNISENRRLEDTQVLNPEWITNGVYSIINSKQLSENKGVIRESKLAGILDKKLYPGNRERGFIMDMMLHFELCYQMPSQNEVFFVPGIFPKDRPKGIEWDESENLTFIFKFDVLPSSVISRFIVRVHPFIYKDYYWRNGVVLDHNIENNYAYISVIPADKRIVIKVRGKGNKRTTLTYVRTEFLKIFYSIDQLKVEGLIPIDSSNEHLVSYDALLAHETLGEEYMVYTPLLRKIHVKSLLDGIEDRINKEALKQQIADGELESVFKKLYQHYKNDNKIIANLGRLKELKKKIGVGTEDTGEANREMQKLRVALLELIDELL